MPITCSKCSNVLKSAAALSSHRIIYHCAVALIHVPQDDGSFKDVPITRTPSGHIHCPICSKEYKCTVSLQMHVKGSCFGDGKTKDCPHCQKTFRHLKFYNSHVEAKVCILAEERARLRAAGQFVPSAKKRSNKELVASSKTVSKSKPKTTTKSNPTITLKSIIKPKSNITSTSNKGTNTVTKPSSQNIRKPVSRGPHITKFKCPLCKDSFNKRHDLQHHFEEVCFEPPFGGQSGRLLCFECSRCFDSSKDLKAHRYNFHQEEITVNINNEDCIITRNEYHMLSCPQCNLTFNYPSYLEAHLNYFCGYMDIVCPECSSPFETTLQLNTHINCYHNIATPLSQESTPELSSPSPSALTSPSSSSLDDPIISRKNKRVRFSCHSCLETFESDKDMREHVFMESCTLKKRMTLKRKKIDIGYRKLKYVKVEI